MKTTLHGYDIKFNIENYRAYVNIARYQCFRHTTRQGCAFMKRTVILIILDGWGIGRKDQSNPIHTAGLTNLPAIRTRYAIGTLQSSGIAVGLPWGAEGDSEVGHLTIGAGKVIYQHYPRITLAIRNGDFFKNEALAGAADYARTNHSALHLIGLLTAGNVHASLEHLKALVVLAKERGVSDVNLHLVTDGKDSPPKSVLPLLRSVKEHLAGIGVGRIASIGGRFYGEDHDAHWNRTEKLFRVLLGEGPMAPDPVAYAAGFLARGLMDEYIEPALIGNEPHPVRDNDAIIFFDFREDSIRQLASAFLLPAFASFPRTLPNNLHVVTMTEYAKAFAAPVAYPPETITNPIGSVLANQGKIQIRIAETEKYAHVTYFFNGYREEPFVNEYRVLIPSKPMLHPEQEPEMRTKEVAARVIESIGSGGFDFVLANFANADVIAHTGNFEAAEAAVRAIDREVGNIAKAALDRDALLLITSDHAHVETMLNPLTGVPETGHHTNLVPFYLIGKEFVRPKSEADADMLEKAAAGILADIAPTILELMEIPRPPEMTGQSLVPLLE